MGYYASGSGSIILQDINHPGYKHVAKALRVTLDDIREAIFERINEVFQTEYATSTEMFSERHTETYNGMYIIDVHHSEECNYHSEDLTELLNLLKPILVSGTEIDFIGCDNAYWCFICYSDGEYSKDYGYVVYEGMECMSATCVFADQGRCHCHMVHGRRPVISDEYDTGCSEYVYDPRKGER